MQGISQYISFSLVTVTIIHSRTALLTYFSLAVSQVTSNRGHPTDRFGTEIICSEGL